MVIITDSEQALDDTSNSSIHGNVSRGSRESLNYLPVEQEVYLFCKQLLQNRLFVGHYQERRLVEFLQTYRDVVVVHKSEMDLKRDLENIKLRLSSSCHSTWIGITGQQSASGTQCGIILWVKLHDLAFGHYWFQIKQVKFTEREVYLRLKMIRPLAVTDSLGDVVQHAVKKTDSQQSVASSSTWGSTNASETTGSTETEQVWTESMLKWRNTIVEELVTYFTTYATFSNLRECFCFLIATLMAVVTGLVYGVRFAGDFSIKFMREASLFIQASTPIVLGIIEFFTKMVGGLYLLLAMMWRGSSNTEGGGTRGGGPQYPSVRASLYTTQYRTPYPYRPLPLPPPTTLHQNTSKNK